TTGRVEIYGSEEAQDRAVQLILAEVSFAKTGSDGTVLKDEPRPAKREDNEAELPPPVKLWVRDRDAGRVIGRGGETVRDVMEKSGADVKVEKSDEMYSGSSERGVKILGTKEQQDK
ncbi:unnamed protein product, partial [Polarella glacialis]